MVPLALVIMMTVLVGSGRADPGEEPDLHVEIVGLKPGSKREVVVRVTNGSDWWSEATRLTVETVAPTPGQKRTLDVPDLNPANDPSSPNQADLVYTLAADCDGQVVKASLSAGKNYMGEKEINLDDNVVQGNACSTRGEAAPTTSGQTVRGQTVTGGPATQSTPWGDNEEPWGDNEAPPMADLPVEFTSGTQETLLVTYPLPYDFRVRNDGADISRSLLIVVEGDGMVSKIAMNQPSGIVQLWKDAGFECQWPTPGSASENVWCSSGSLRSGASLNLRVFVQFLKAGKGTVIVTVRSALHEATPDNDLATRAVQILRVP
jgi:hypothetical protein